MVGDFPLIHIFARIYANLKFQITIVEVGRWIGKWEEHLEYIRKWFEWYQRNKIIFKDQRV